MGVSYGCVLSRGQVFCKSSACSEVLSLPPFDFLQAKNSPGWPQTFCMVEDDVELLMIPPLYPKSLRLETGKPGSHAVLGYQLNCISPVPRSQLFKIQGQTTMRTH